jgi:hypothetical protein
MRKGGLFLKWQKNGRHEVMKLTVNGKRIIVRKIDLLAELKNNKKIIPVKVPKIIEVAKIFTKEMKDKETLRNNFCKLCDCDISNRYCPHRQ